MNELTLYRTLHSLLAVVRLANELRNAVAAIQGGAGGTETPYGVDGLDVDTLECFQALAETLSAIEARSIPVLRWKRELRTRDADAAAAAADVSRETWPAPFEDEVSDGSAS